LLDARSKQHVSGDHDTDAGEADFAIPGPVLARKSLRPMIMPTMLATITPRPEQSLIVLSVVQRKEKPYKKTDLPERIFRKIKQKTRALEISNLKKYTYTYTTPISESHAVFSKPGQYEKRNITYKK